MAKNKYNLCVVAHPDDETLYFAGLLMKKRKIPWVVACVTDGNADGRGVQRNLEFKKACKLLKVSQAVWLGFADRFESRLNIEQIVTSLSENFPSPELVYTHGVLGEYGHPHHQDVSFAVHRLYAKKHRVMSVAYNCFPDECVALSPAEYRLKSRILAEVYAREFFRFAHLVPASAAENFCATSWVEVEALYQFFAHGVEIKKPLLKKFRWLSQGMPSLAYKNLNRIF